MTDALPGQSLAPTNCIECIMAWLLFGDGAICLLHRQPVYWRGKP
jgi:hypothetical protein